MDPRYIQWQTFRPTKRQGQPWNEDSSQDGLVRPIQRPSQDKSNRQQMQRRGGCCGKRAAN